MTKLLDLGLNKVGTILFEMANLAQSAVIKAVSSYEEDVLTTKDEIFELSSKLRFLQDEVSELSIDLIARFQPVATDLRYIKSCMEISYDFSRFGRYAYDIIAVLEIVGPLKSCDKSQVIHMSKIVLDMMDLSVSALHMHNHSILNKIYEMENTVDLLFTKGMRESFQNRSSIETYSDCRCSISSSLILRYLERISDHACYIADSVNYIVTGIPTPRT